MKETRQFGPGHDRHKRSGAAVADNATHSSRSHAELLFTIKGLKNSDNGKESMWEEGTRDGDTEEMWGKKERRKREKKSISSEEEDFRSAPTSINWESRRSGFFPIHRVEEHGVEEEGWARGFEAFPSSGRCCWNTHTPPPQPDHYCQSPHCNRKVS